MIKYIKISFCFFLFFLVLNNLSAQIGRGKCYPGLDICIKSTIIKKATCNSLGEVKIELIGNDVDKITYNGQTPNIYGVFVNGVKVRFNEVPYGAFYIRGYSTFINGSEFLFEDNSFMPYALNVTAASGRRCPGENTVNVNVTAQNGSGSYTYSCDNQINTTGVFTGLLPNADSKYLVKIVDNDCPSKMQIDTLVWADDFASLEITVTGDLMLCPGGNLDLVATVDAPLGSRFVWTNNGVELSNTDRLQMINLTPAQAGNYIISVFVPGCNKPIQRSVSVQVDKPVVPLVKDSLVCHNAVPIDFVNLVSATSSSYTLLWYTSETATQPITDLSYSTATVGPVTFYVSQKDINLGCEGARTAVTIMVKALPDAIAVTDVKIIGSTYTKPTIIIEALPGFSYLLYKEQVGGAIIAQVNNPTNDTKDVVLSDGTNVSNGDYYIQTQSTAGCYASNRTKIKVATSPMIIGDTVVCDGNRIVLISTEVQGASYRWDYPNGNANTRVLDINATATNSGVYTLTVTTPYGIVLYDKVFVKVKTIALPNAINNYNYCINQVSSPLSAQALPGHILFWYDPNGVELSGPPTPLTNVSGTVIYQVAQQDPQGCKSAKMDIMVTTKAITDLSNLEIKVCMSLRPKLLIANSNVAHKYVLVNVLNDTVSNWITGNSGLIQIQSNRDVIENTTYRLVVRSNSTCEASKSIPITALTQLILQNSSSSVCIGGVISLYAQEFEGATYTWTLPSGLPQKMGNPLIIPNVTDQHNGGYKLRITLALNGSQCEVDVPTFIVKVGKPNALVVNQPFIQCVNQPSKPLGIVPDPGNALVWFDVNGSEIILPNPPNHIANTANYQVAQYVIGDRNCMSDRVNLIIQTNDLAELPNFPNYTVCANSTPRVEILNSIEKVSYYLIDNSGTRIDTVIGDGNTLYLEAKENVIADTRYEVGMESSEVCVSSEKKSINFLINALYINPSKAPAYQRGVAYTLQLETNVAPPHHFRIASGSLPDHFTLSTDGLISGTASITGSSEPKDFVVELFDPSGCSVNKAYRLETSVFIPQAFSPNGDGVNDYFMKSYQVLIFDRQGVKLFEGSDGWDGTRNGVQVGAGTYFYRIIYIDDKGDSKTAFGYIMVL